MGIGLHSLLLPSVGHWVKVKIRLNGINSYVGGIPASKLVVHEGSLAVAAKQDEDFIPMTVIRTERVFTRSILEDTVKSYKVNDVFQSEFLRCKSISLRPTP